MDALLVIDVDGHDGWSSDMSLLSDERKKVACAIRQELARWRESGGLIAFVVLSYDSAAQTEQNSNKCLVCDLPPQRRLAGFLEHRHGTQFEPVFIKGCQDAFTNSALAEFLRQKKVSRLFLAGCNTFLCVLDTAKGAIERGFSVSLLENCVYPGFLGSAEKSKWRREVMAGHVLSHYLRPWRRARACIV